jgi:uncharacterized BrkB/YihY/UPF0761 family membrane protein
LLLGIASIASIVLGDAVKADQVATRLTSILPPGARDQVVELIFRTRRDSPLLLAIAVLAMVWASAGATGVVERVESRLLGVRRRGPFALKLRQLGLGAGMALLIALMAIAATEATNLRRRLGAHVPHVVVLLGSLAVVAVICALLYRFATTRHLAWRAALRGGLVAGVVVEATPLLAGYYARAVAGRTAVQVFLVLAGLLFAAYIVAQGLLIGAGLAVSAQRSLDQAAGLDGGSAL